MCIGPCVGFHMPELGQRGPISRHTQLGFGCEEIFWIDWSKDISNNWSIRFEFYGHIAVMLRQTMPQHALAHARHTCGVPRHLMNPCTKYGAKDLFTLECWHGAVLCHLNKSSNVFISFGHVISQFLQKFHIWNNRLFQMPFERVKSTSAQPNARVLA